MSNTDLLLVLFCADWSKGSKDLRSSWGAQDCGVGVKDVNGKEVHLLALDLETPDHEALGLDLGVSMAGTVLIYFKGEKIGSLEPADTETLSQAAQSLAARGDSAATAAVAPLPSSHVVEPADAPTGAVGVIQALAETGTPCVRIFVAGDVSHCGKTTVCLGLLGALLRAGIHKSKIGYIKPATQCEAPDLMQRWCDASGVAHVEVIALFVYLTIMKCIRRSWEPEAPKMYIHRFSPVNIPVIDYRAARRPWFSSRASLASSCSAELVPQRIGLTGLPPLATLWRLGNHFSSLMVTCLYVCV